MAGRIRNVRPQRHVVTDSGPGIDRARADHLVSGTVVPGDPLTVGGLGLGIPLAAHSLRAAGGTLTYDTEPGRGTRFVLRIPTFTAG